MSWAGPSSERICTSKLKSRRMGVEEAEAFLGFSAIARQLQRTSLETAGRQEVAASVAKGAGDQSQDFADYSLFGWLILQALEPVLFNKQQIDWLPLQRIKANFEAR